MEPAFFVETSLPIGSLRTNICLSAHAWPIVRVSASQRRRNVHVSELDNCLKVSPVHRPDHNTHAPCSFAEKEELFLNDTNDWKHVSPDPNPTDGTHSILFLGCVTTWCWCDLFSEDFWRGVFFWDVIFEFVGEATCILGDISRSTSSLPLAGYQIPSKKKRWVRSFQNKSRRASISRARTRRASTSRARTQRALLLHTYLYPWVSIPTLIFAQEINLTPLHPRWNIDALHPSLSFWVLFLS